jgi:hypothetical protein
VTFRADLGVESSLCEPSAHFLVDILRLEGMGFDEGELGFEKGGAHDLNRTMFALSAESKGG